MKIGKLAKESVALTRQLVREQIAPLLTLFVVGTLLSLTLEDTLQTLSKTEENQRWILQLSMGLWELIEGILLILILSWGIPKIRALTEAHFIKQPFQENYLNSFMAEYFRLLGNVLLWGLLLIIPGFLRYCRLIFVPYVTLFAKPYRDGQADALGLAADLSRGRYALILGLILGTTLLQTGVEFLSQLLPELHILPMRIVFAGLSFMISIWLYAVLYLQFEEAMEEYKWS